MLALGTSRTLLLTPLMTVGVAVVAAVAPSFGTAVALARRRSRAQAIDLELGERADANADSAGRARSVARARARRARARGVRGDRGDPRVLAARERAKSRGGDGGGRRRDGVRVHARRAPAYRDALRRAIDERTLDLDDVAPKSFDAETRATLLAELRSSDDRRAGLAAELLCEGSQPPDDEVLAVAVQARARSCAPQRSARSRDTAAARYRRRRRRARSRRIPTRWCRVEAARVVVQLGVAPEEARASLDAHGPKGDAHERRAAKVALRVIDGERDPAELLGRFR